MTDTRDQFHERESQVAPPVRSGEIAPGLSQLTCLTVADALARAHRVKIYHGIASYPLDQSEVDAASHALRCHTDILAALTKIEKWFGEFPETGEFWDKEKTSPVSYAAQYGTNGERDYMRAVARAAIAKATMTAPQSEQAPLSREKGDA